MIVWSGGRKHNRYERYDMKLTIPHLGAITESTRLSALLGFVGTVSLALSFPGQIQTALNLSER